MPQMAAFDRNFLYSKQPQQSANYYDAPVSALANVDNHEEAFGDKIFRSPDKLDSDQLKPKKISFSHKNGSLLHKEKQTENT